MQSKTFIECSLTASIACMTLKSYGKLQSVSSPIFILPVWISRHCCILSMHFQYLSLTLKLPMDSVVIVQFFFFMIGAHNIGKQFNFNTYTMLLCKKKKILMNTVYTYSLCVTSFKFAVQQEGAPAVQHQSIICWWLYWTWFQTWHKSIAWEKRTCWVCRYCQQVRSTIQGYYVTCICLTSSFFNCEGTTVFECTFRTCSLIKATAAGWMECDILSYDLIRGWQCSQQINWSNLLRFSWG